MRNFILVGLTGPTGAGKTTVSGLLKEKGCFILDGDVMARKALEKGSTCLAQLALSFGQDIILKNGEANRSLLAARAFSTEENTKKLNQIVHPWICLDTMERVNSLRTQHTSPIIILDAAAIFESNMDILCDCVISVLAAPSLRKARIIKRDNLTEEQAQKRISAQKADDFYRLRSDYIIYTDNGIEQAKLQTEQIFTKLKKKKGGGCN